MNASRYLVVDIEATCSDTGEIPPEQMETIEVGAVLVDGQTLVAISEFQSFVRPVRHPNLTTFCTRLTSITQADVDNALDFKGLMGPFKAWLYQKPGLLTFCSWGDFDAKQLAQDAAYHKVANPIGARHVNLKTEFTRRHGLGKKPGLHEAVELAGPQFLGQHHRGIDDARNLARLLPFVFGGNRLPVDQ